MSVDNFKKLLEQYQVMDKEKMQEFFDARIMIEQGKSIYKENEDDEYYEGGVWMYVIKDSQGNEAEVFFNMNDGHLSFYLKNQNILVGQLEAKSVVISLENETPILKGYFYEFDFETNIEFSANPIFKINLSEKKIEIE